MVEGTQQTLATIKVLAYLNRLMLNAFKASTKEKLSFLILNDTVQVVPYQRAFLWDLSHKKPKFLGASGQSAIVADSAVVQTRELIVQDLADPSQQQTLSIDSVKSQKKLFTRVSQDKTEPNIHWVPLFVEEKLTLGLWLERWEASEWHAEERELLAFLAQGYQAAWERFAKTSFFASAIRGKGLWIAAAILILLITIHVPLRVIAPMEVVAEDPYLITAPVDGVIAQLEVQPGENVHKGQLLASYDDTTIVHELQGEESKLGLLKAKVKRAEVDYFQEQPPTSYQGTPTSKEGADLEMAELDVQREEAQYRLMRAQYEKMHIRAPIAAVVELDNAEGWRGHPVHVGDQIMIVFNPEYTKVRMWIAQTDNVFFDFKQPIRVFLDVEPAHEFSAQLTYIASSATLSPQGVNSFVAEAAWIKKDPRVKPGLKGSAVLYGERVSLFYWLIRHPWAFIRSFFGV